MVKHVDFRRILGFPIIAIVAAGCQVTKSSNPLSPAVAGPIAGVTISTPNLLEPGQDWQIRMRDQPIKLMFQNADTSGSRPLTYTIEVATDASFASVIFKRTQIQPGNVTTTFQLPDALPTGRLYWWRVRAEDGANIGEYSKPVSFNAISPVTISAPVAVTPSGKITKLAPEFKVRAGAKSGPYEKIQYTLQVSNSQTFAPLTAMFIVDEAGAETIVAQNYAFLNNRTHYWRVQARDTGESGAVSPWSNTLTFTTDMPLPTPAPAPPSGGDGPPPGNGDWTQCGSTPGKAIVECVRSAVYRRSTLENAFDVTKRVAWLLRGKGWGLLLKPGGENIITWNGKTVSISRIMLPDGHIVKVLSDAGPGGSNGASWQECFDKKDLECYVEPDRYVPAMQP
jgi:hypothetical protein